MTVSELSTGQAVSDDGTTIGYRRTGSGPGLVVLHGAMSGGYHHAELAAALAGEFSVILPDRRGRGLSGPYRPGDTIAAEVQDLDAVVRSTGARFVFGVSTGGVIALHAAAGGSPIERLAVFETPLFADDESPRKLLAQLEDAMAHGDLARAMTIAMQGAKLGPALLNMLPVGLATPLSRYVLNQSDRKPWPDYVPVRELAQNLPYDCRIVVENSGSENAFATIAIPVLLVGGRRSHRYLGEALARLEQVLPDSQRVEITGVGHAASWNKRVGGRPDRVAAELRRFFT